MISLFTEIDKIESGSLYRIKSTVGIVPVKNGIANTLVAYKPLKINQIILTKDTSELDTDSMWTYLLSWNRVTDNIEDLILRYGITLDTNQDFVHIHLKKISEKYFEKLD
jgi:hypothetical protein